MIVIDKVVLALRCVTDDPKFNQGRWDALIDSQASKLKLTASELFLIRDYFSSVAWKQLVHS